MSLTRFRSSISVLFALAVVIGLVWWKSPLFGAETPVVIAAPLVDNPRAAGAPRHTCAAPSSPRR